jgi:DNA-binding NtrC family response regulator
MKPPEQLAYNILVVDDEPSVRDSIRMLLVHFGHAVQTSENGAAALALLSKHSFHLVITDYFMQGMKGDELASIIKIRHPGMPVIMATAFADELMADGRLD